MLGASYQVNALVGVWKFKQLTGLCGHLAQGPNVPKFGSEFRLGLEVELDEPLERAIHLALGRPPSDQIHHAVYSLDCSAAIPPQTEVSGLCFKSGDKTDISAGPRMDAERWATVETAVAVYLVRL